AAAFRLWLAYLYLRLHRIDDAAKLTAAWKPDQMSDLGAYALAWVAFAGGDRERARRAITTAAATWKDGVSRPAVERDLVLILARTGTEVAAAARLIAEAAGGDAQRRYLWMFKLSEAYKYAGDYQAASAALEAITEEAAKGSKGAGMPADDLVGFRYRQADYAFRLNRPGEAAERAMQARKELAACGAKCPEATTQPVMERILKLAQFSHTVYAKSLDGRHYDAAVALYQHYIAIPGRPDAAEARGYLSSLQETRATAQPTAGKHDQDVLLNFFWARREAVAACYEAALLIEPGLEGMLKLSLEIDAGGEVSGATSEPGAGAQGMAAVAGCLIERARTWTFPSRTVPGKTTLVTPLELRRQQPGSGPPGSGAPAGDPAKSDPAKSDPAAPPSKPTPPGKGPEKPPG
ncbi:MAG TPA: AgmX/PglI C-terminal domain-containing protein, partial [Kofleriaceae bacterium]|nr:AgmX/PglI C-terminal domain-containing protein [Kofleriaceae bacterium]